LDFIDAAVDTAALSCELDNLSETNEEIGFMSVKNVQMIPSKTAVALDF